MFRNLWRNNEKYIELETRQGIDYIRIAFIKDMPGKEIDAKEIGKKAVSF